MLKFTYTEAGMYLEHVAMALEKLVAQRALLALRTGQKLYIEPGRAAFLLPADMAELKQLQAVLQDELSQVMTITPVDLEFVEVSLEGHWLAATAEAQEGVFIATICDRTELFIYKLWQSTHRVSSLM